MIVTIYQGEDGYPVVTVQGDTIDSPAAVAMAYLEALKVLKEALNK